MSAHIDADLIIKLFDDLFLMGKFDLADGLVRFLVRTISALDVQSIVLILSATLPAKDKLHYRADFTYHAEGRIKSLAPDRAENLMKGLR